MRIILLITKSLNIVKMVSHITYQNTQKSHLRIKMQQSTNQLNPTTKKIIDT